MPEPVILTSLEDRVATLTLNRPDRLNALNPELIQLAIATLRAWSADPEVAVVVVTGAGSRTAKALVISSGMIIGSSLLSPVMI